MRRYEKILVISLIASVIILAGFITQLPPQPQTITVEVEKWRTRTVVQPIYTDRPVYPDDYREFASQEELSRWQLKNYLGEVDGWNCVDYAKELQKIALKDGYIMSIELIDNDGNKEIDHAICSTWIGDECYFLEPQSIISWLGALKSS